MKRRYLTVTPDNKPAGVRIILANSKGHILYDREKDKTKKAPAGRDPARVRRGNSRMNQRHYTTREDGTQ